MGVTLSPQPSMNTNILIISVIVTLVNSFPSPPDPRFGEYPVIDRTWDRANARFPRDQMVAEDTSYGQQPVGRVKIQVYRGPTKDYFAPWGYYNTQPADLAIHHG